MSTGGDDGGSNLSSVVTGYGSSGTGRGSGTYTGSGSLGTLPPCTECFGHGSNPDSNPKCKLGCRGSDEATTRQKNIRNKQLNFNANVGYHACGQGKHCPEKSNNQNNDKDRKSGFAAHENERAKTLKLQLIVFTCVGCVILIVAVALGHYVRRRRLARVVLSEEDSTTIENPAVVM